METLDEFLGQLTNAVDISVDFSHGDKLQSILKAADFCISLEGLQPLEALVEHLSVCSEFLKNPCFVLIEAPSYFSDDELTQLYAMAVYKKWNLLCLNSRKRATRRQVENITLIDGDLCTLHL